MLLVMLMITVRICLGCYLLSANVIDAKQNVSKKTDEATKLGK